MTVQMQMQPLSLSDVKIDSSFWTPRQEVNRSVTLPHEYSLIEKNGNLQAYQWDWWDASKGTPPWRIWVGDIGKWVEACGYALAARRDESLEKLVEQRWIASLKGQKEDGYLYPNPLRATSGGPISRTCTSFTRSATTSKARWRTSRRPGGGGSWTRSAAPWT